MKKTHLRVDQILSCLGKKVTRLDGSQLQNASAYDAMLQAAKYGTIEFIELMKKANPDLLWATDRNKRGIFAHAILNRKKDVFDLIHDVHGRKEIVLSRTDVFGNNLLHLAAQLGPSSALAHRCGAALQMQSEIQWFKAVEEIVHPKCKEAKNEDGKKPHEIFMEQHKQLAKEGEKWAKDTASAFSVVGTLITTILFAAAFTLPGGNNQSNGEPMFLHDRAFTVFIVADAISLFASSTSVLIFIGILTSSYAEKDFLKALPCKLLFALVTLFFSVVFMMVAFCAALFAMFKGKEYQPLVIVAMVLASIPIIVFIPSQLRLFVEIFDSTTRSNVCSSIKKENAKR
ncbi:ankyrin repeat-containing protein ITN1-like [Arachis stenosperma]|uniref:ankyrin repeat-containing protein ITN1-like n=1 Tax=Arachis stenosperma TaxID=217475 RepID=UPI0025AC2E93|nr:ankyrin repeat-containing protein ITN1-like [Arachis stenosperma]XP_057758399.1 ankyrin repeat-containing protein ITN1-like [Arachis stenosperma]